MADLLNPTSEDLKVLAGFPSTASDGGLAVGNASGDYVDLPVGADGQVLTLVAGQPTWSTSSGAGHVIKEEGVALPQRAGLNFIGVLVSASDNIPNDDTDVTIAIPPLHVTNSMLAGSIDNAKLLTNPLDRANHTGTQLASTISDFDTQVRTSRLDQMAIPTAAVNFNNQTLNNLGTETISGLPEEAAPTSGDFLLVHEATANAMRKVDIGNLPTGGGGEANTGANVGTGVGVFRDKTGVTLNFNSLIGGNGITVANTVDDLTIDIDGTVVTLLGSQILLNKTLITPTIGDYNNATHNHETPAGGGQLAHTAVADFDAGVQTNRLDQMAIPTATVDFNNQTLSNLGVGTISALPQELVPTSGDFILVHEATANAMRKVDIGNLPTGGGEANTIASVGGGTFALTAAVPKVGVSLQVISVSNGTGMNASLAADVLTLAVDSTVVLNNIANAYTAGSKQTFEGNATTAPIRFVPGANPSTKVAGDIWLTTGDLLQFRNNADSADITLATDSNNLSFFAATSSSQLAGVISDETGTGVLVFNNTPTLTTPTIADFTNANHDHSDAANGGALGNNVVADAQVSASAAIQVSKLANGTAFQRIRTNAAGTANEFFTETAAIPFVIDGGGAAITTGIKGHLEVPFDCEIVAARLFADQTGSIVVDINKDTFANYPPTGADTITGAAPPTISASDKSEDTTLTGWTTVLSQGDILQFEVDSAATITFATLSLTVNKRG